MKIAFVFMGAENLGIEYLSSVARAAGHETALFFDPAAFSGKLMLDSPFLAKLTDRREKLARAVATSTPDAVAFSCFTGNYLWALDIARLVKKLSPRTTTLFGGVHVTSCPDVAIREDCVDALLIGEGEAVFAALLESAVSQRNAVPGAWIKDGTEIIKEQPLPPAAELDTLLFPDKQLFYAVAPALQHHYLIMTARGCPFSCTYCYKSLDAWSRPGAKPVRQRSVDNVINELLPFKKRGRMKLVAIRDDIFGLNRKWLDEFTEKYTREISIPYFCYTHPGTVDAERAELLRRGGCVFTTMGVQSADAKTRRELLNRNYTNEQVVESVSLLKRSGIQVSLDHITGLPGETPQDLIEAARLYAALRPQRLLTFWLECFPGTRMMDICRERGLLSDAQVEQIKYGHAGYRYAGGSLGADNKVARLVNFLNLIPLLPASVATRMAKSGSAAKTPPWQFLQHLFMTLNAIKMRDTFFFYNVRFMFSRKKMFSGYKKGPASGDFNHSEK